MSQTEMKSVLVPGMLAHRLRQQIRAYLGTTYDIRDPRYRRELDEFLAGSDGIFKGPWIDVKLPFRAADAGAAMPITITGKFPPYVHQLRAWTRLNSSGKTPKSTVVATGTGSGKTECFLNPILDHAMRHKDEGGTVALLFYPMNALAFDQARRIAEMIAKDPRLSGVTAGLLVGENAEDDAPRKGKKTMGRDHIIDDRATIVSKPPHILLTNYKMMDLLLLKPEFAPLWDRIRRVNSPVPTAPSLQYLVLDEMHTYDGARGADVGLLVRRLKARLGIGPGRLACVGTSATLSNTVEGKTKLLTFAKRLTGEEFDDDSVITEDRLRPEEVFAEVKTSTRPIPADSAVLEAKLGDSLNDVVGRASTAWLGSGAKSAVDLGRQVMSLAVTRALIDSLAEGPLTEGDLLNQLAAKGFSLSSRQLHSFLALVAHARKELRELPGANENAAGDTSADERPATIDLPLFHVRVQLWLREMTGVLGRVGGPGSCFVWESQSNATSPPQGIYLPPVFCEECGTYGFISKETNGVLERRDIKKILRVRGDRGPTVRYLFPWSGEIPEVEQGLGSSASIGVCRHCGSINPHKSDGPCSQCMQPYEHWLMHVALSKPKTQGGPQKDLRLCPGCETKQSLKTLSARMNTLTSISSGEIFLSNLTPAAGKRLLVFSEAVQDASHRAGYLNARTFRFNFRTAIQSVVAEDNNHIAMVDLGQKILPYWVARLGSEGAAVAALTPRDLMHTEEFTSYWEGKREPLLDLLRKRILWEVYIEYCLRSQVGRTLEKTLCSVAHWQHPDTQGKIAIAFDDLINRHGRGEIQDAGAQALHLFWQGLVRRLLHKGAVALPAVFDQYRRLGKRFQLSKKMQPWIGGLPSGRVGEGMEVGQLPNFPTTNPNSDIFDYVGAPAQGRSWYQDWFVKCFGATSRVIHPQDVTQGLRAIFDALATAGLLVPCIEERGGFRNYGLDVAHLTIASPVTQLRCTICRDSRQVPGLSAADHVGTACRMMRCEGKYAVAEPDTSSEFYQNVYGSGLVARIFAEEHTGMLGRSDREKVETTFKAKDEERRPSDVNLLSCTSTLEMGIDIGDLSATVAAGLPKSAINFQQQIGRAGRTSGSAFIAALAQARPRDLLFFDEPQELIAGHIDPPGCFLDAPDILRRQFTAFALEANYHQLRGKHPKITVQTVLADLGQAVPVGFWQEFEKIVTGASSPCLSAFKSACHLSDIRPGTWDVMIKEWLVPPKNGERCRLVQALMTMFQDFLGDKSRLDAEKRALEEALAPIKSKARKDEEDVKAENQLKMEIGAVLAELDSIGAHDGLHSLLAKKGFLPNYAFSEDSVELIAFKQLKTMRDGRSFAMETFDRPAGTAIRDLAPGNTFYGGGRKVEVSTIDLGKDNKRYIEAWNLCQDCGHLEAGHDDHANKKCRNCTSPKWGDAGARIQMVRLRRVKSVIGDESEGDETEKRVSEAYRTRKMFSGDAGEIWGINTEDTYLGLEFIPKMTLREINFGFADARSQAAITIAGQDYPTGFVICHACGRAEPRGGGPIKHTGSCPRGRSTPGVLGRTVGPQARANNPVLDAPLLLYREVHSEAVRVYVPCRSLRPEIEAASYQAALIIGLRRHFGGTPDHIIVEHETIVLPDDNTERHTLMIFDTVPGGSGFMKELSTKESFFEIAAEGLEALKNCSCASKPTNDDGCIRCVYGAVPQRDIHNVSRKRAVEILEHLLGKKDAFQKLDSSAMRSRKATESRLEDMLCAIFDASKADEQIVRVLEAAGVEVISATDKLAEKGTGVITLKDKSSGIENTWRIDLQRTLKNDDANLHTRPDFILTKIADDTSAKTRPIALFTDGFAYHAAQDTGDRLVDDFEKRTKLSLVGAGQPMRVWSLSWVDVEGFGANDLTFELCFFGREQDPACPTIKTNQLTLLLQYLAADAGDRTNGGAGWNFAEKSFNGLVPKGNAAQLSESALFNSCLTIFGDHDIGIQPIKYKAGWAAEKVCCAAIGTIDGQTPRLFSAMAWDFTGIDREKISFEKPWRQFLATHNFMGLLTGGVLAVVVDKMQ